MALNVGDLAKTILAAAQDSLKKSWPDVKEYAEAEAKKTAQTITMIETLFLAGKITKTEARIHLRMQKNSSISVLLAIEGLGILAVEKAINAAVRAVKDVVNTALGFSLV
jgi:hypothetical protein